VLLTGARPFLLRFGRGNTRLRRAENQIVSASTAGKGPGVVMRAENRSGALRLTIGPNQRKAILELLELGGQTAQIGLGPRELKQLAKALDRVANALSAASMLDEETQRL
jgi:hypothetical protein